MYITINIVLAIAIAFLMGELINIIFFPHGISICKNRSEHSGKIIKKAIKEQSVIPIMEDKTAKETLFKTKTVKKDGRSYEFQAINICAIHNALMWVNMTTEMHGVMRFLSEYFGPSNEGEAEAIYRASFRYCDEKDSCMNEHLQILQDMYHKKTGGNLDTEKFKKR